MRQLVAEASRPRFGDFALTGIALDEAGGERPGAGGILALPPAVTP